jgi:hypothetical protein
LIPGKKTTLVLQRFTDDYALKTRKWTDIRDLSGVLTDLSGREAFIIGQMRVKADHEYYCLVPIGITITEVDRLKGGATFYKIKRVIDYGKHLKLTLETGTGENVG